MARNIDLKVPFTMTDDRRQALARLGARAAASLEQTDTYFHCREGRLKLREIIERSPSGETSRKAELIAYRRPDDAGFRGSDYTVAAVPDAASMKTALAAALGIRTVVKKHRELMLWENVRIHIDSVDELGSFLEFEAVIAPAAGGRMDDEAHSHERLRRLSEVLKIDPADAIAGSYADMKPKAI